MDWTGIIKYCLVAAETHVHYPYCIMADENLLEFGIVR